MNAIKRRTFLKTLGTTGVTAALSSQFLHAVAPAPRASNPDQSLKDIIDAAMERGAGYAEARYVFLQNQAIQSRRDQVYSINDTESGGFSLRVFKDGNFGFAAQSTFDALAPKSLATKACNMASALGRFQRTDLEVSDRIAGESRRWTTPHTRDPFQMALKEKIDFVLDLSTQSLQAQDIAYSVANLFSGKREVRYLNSLGGLVEQVLLSIYPNFGVTVFDPTSRRIDSRSSRLEARAGGFDICTTFPFKSEIEAATAEVIEYSKAERLATGEYDLIIDPTHLWRIFYDSIAASLDPLTLLGLDGANPRYTLFSRSDIGRKLFEAPALNIDFDNTIEGGLATCGWDDAGHSAARGTLVQEGTLAGIPRSDEFDSSPDAASPSITRSSGWQSPPRFAMPNMVLRPATNGKSIEEMIADTERGLYLVGRGKPVISPNRKWMQGQSQIAWLIENGKRTKLVRDIQYNTSVLYLWNVLSEVGNAAERLVAGDLFPQSSNPLWELPFSVSVPPARFRNVTMIAAGKEDAK